MAIYVGTSGYSYKEWKGSFYPEDLKNDAMLEHYGTRLPSVEINNTFYRLPKTSVLDQWSAQVPEHFRFTIKASRRITHMKRLKNANEETEYLLTTLETLGAKLGVVLYQCPPTMKKDLERLRGFLELLESGPRAVFEFRHESWFDEETTDVLREHGAALCIADNDDAPEPDLARTASFGYLRLRRADYDADAQKKWLDRIRDAGWDDAYVYFKHEDTERSPGVIATEFLERTRG